MRTHVKATFIITFIFFLIFSLQQATIASTYEPMLTVSGRVTKVFDGDTIQVVTLGYTRLRVRLYGIDAPEVAIRSGKVIVPGQPFGSEAKSYLSSLILGKTVRLDIIETDRYRRTVSVVWLNGRNINLEMVKTGMAEAYVEHLRVQPYRHEFIQADIEATKKKTGIWTQRNYERPSDFRKRMNVRGD